MKWERGAFILNLLGVAGMCGGLLARFAFGVSFQSVVVQAPIGIGVLLLLAGSIVYAHGGKRKGSNEK